MKNILFIIAITLSMCVNAQINKVYKFAGISGTKAIKDSVSNTGADTMFIQSQHYSETVSIQPIITKVSGTITSNATCQVYASVDGVNFISLLGDSVHLTNVATATNIFVIKDNPYAYYRVITTGAGTMKAYIKVLFLPNGQSGLTVRNFNMTSQYSLTNDTVTNTGSNYVTLQVQNWYNTVSIQPIVTKISGTAAGTVTLQGSNDGVNFVTVNTKYLSTLDPYFTTGAAATLTITNVTTNTGVFVVIGSPYLYYRLSYAGSGTMVCTLKGVMLPSK